MASPKPAPPPLPKRPPPPFPDKSGRETPKKSSRNKHVWETLIPLAIVSLCCFGGAASRLGEQAGVWVAILFLLIGACAIYFEARFNMIGKLFLFPFVALGAVFRWLKRLIDGESPHSVPKNGDDKHE